MRSGPVSRTIPRNTANAGSLEEENVRWIDLIPVSQRKRGSAVIVDA